MFTQRKSEEKMLMGHAVNAVLQQCCKVDGFASN